MNGTEIAKFFAGFATNQVLTHGALGLSGVQFELFGIPYTPEFNGMAAGVWALIAFVLAYYGWAKTSQSLATSG